VQRLEAAEQANAQLRRELEELKTREAAAPSKVALKSAHGTYLTAEPDGRTTHRENQPASWQTFRLEKIS
jgi:hypothetical protein